LRDESDDEANGLFVSQHTNDSKVDITAQDHHNGDESQIDASVQDNNSDHDEDEEYGTFESTYDEGEENNPACAAYDPDFEVIQERLIKMSMEASVVLDFHDSNTEIVQKLRKRAEEMSIIPKPPPSMIGLLGEAGAGVYLH
jgi:hypothetical protein